MSAPQTPFYPMTHDDAQDLIAAIGEQSKFADPYDSTATYFQGDHCIHAGKYYAAKQDISTAEEWTAAHWEEVQVGEEITAQAKSIGKILPVITGTTNNSGYTISSEEYFEANGKLYKATASIPIGNAWSSSATEQTDHGAINALNSNITALSGSILSTQNQSTLELALHNTLYDINSQRNFGNMAIGTHLDFVMTWTTHDFYVGTVTKVVGSYIKGTLTNGLNFYAFSHSITTDTLTLTTIA